MKTGEKRTLGRGTWNRQLQNKETDGESPVNKAPSAGTEDRSIVDICIKFSTKSIRLT
jgi:hypothetical protein